MLRRLLVTTMIVAVVTAILFGLPIAVLSERYLLAGAVDRLEADAQRAAHIIALAEEDGREVNPDRVAASVRDHVHLVAWQNDVELFEAGEPVPAEDAMVREAEAAEGILVQAREPRSRVGEETALVRYTVLAIGLAAVLVAGGIGWWQARRLSRPLVELAEGAERLGSGDPRPQGRRYGVSELDRVAEVLDSSAKRIAAMLAAERQLSQDASHQLRTPLTALYMRLEEIETSDDPEAVREEAATALTQVERLSTVVDQLLSQRRGSHDSRRTVRSVDLAIEQQVAEWQPAFDAERRRIEVTGEEGLTVEVGPGTLSQIVATLLENALRHGGGTVIIHRRRTLSGSVVLEVSDEGPGIPPELGQQVFERRVSGGQEGTGLGLALARDLADADGGRLELVSLRPAVFAVFLRHVDPLAPTGRTAAAGTSPGGDQTADDSPAPARSPESDGSAGRSASGWRGSRKTKRR